MHAFLTLPWPLRQNLMILFAAGLCFWSSLASQLPTLPLYIRDIGGSEQQIGFVMGAFAIGLLGSRAWLGRLADQRSRKIVLLIGLAVAAIAPLFYLSVTSVAVLIGVRAFHGISIAAFATAYSTLVVDFSPSEQRGELIGVMSLVNPIGIALGPALGGMVQAEVGYKPLFLMASGLSILGLLWSSWVQDSSVVQQPQPPQDRLQKSNLPSPFWRLLNTPRLKIPATVMLLIGLTFGTLSTFVPLLIGLAQVQLNAGWFYTAAAIASFSVRVLTGRASDRVGRGCFISISLLFYTLSMALIWMAQTEMAFLAAGFLEGCGAGILIPMMAALMADRSQPQERGRIFSLCMVGFDLGIAISGLLIGTIASYIGIRHIFLLATGFTSLALLLFLTRSGKDLSHSLAFALGKGRDNYALAPLNQSS